MMAGRPLVVSSPHTARMMMRSAATVAAAVAVMVAASSIGLGSAAEASACLPVLKGQVAPVPGTFQPGGRCPSCDGGRPVAVGTTASADGSFCPTAEVPGPPPPTPAPPTACGAQPEAMFNWTVGGQCLDADPAICSKLPAGDGCSYKFSLAPQGAATAFLWNRPARAGCVGAPTVIDGPIPLNTCAVFHGGGGGDKSWVVLLKMVGPQTVTEMVYTPGPAPPPSGGSCTGTPLATVSFTVDGSCHQAATDVCNGQPGSPPTCSYNGTVTGQTFNLWGIWAGTGCTGTQTQSPAPIPLNVCEPTGSSSDYMYKMVLAAPQRVNELIYEASPPPAAGCSGAPAETFSYVADGTCRQAATDVCTGSKVASPCSYKATVTSDEKTFNLAGPWAGLGCTGKPVKPDSGPVPVGVCIPAGTVGIEIRVQGKNVSELIYQSAPPGPPIGPPSVPEAACDATLAQFCGTSQKQGPGACSQCVHMHATELQHKGCKQARISTFCTGFEAACTSTDDHGWPRFTSQSALASSPWVHYFEAVYGELPSTYPVCVYDFWYLDKTAFFAAGLDKIVNKPIVTNPEAVQEGDLFGQAGSGIGGGGLQIYHGEWTPAPNNTWVEIQHTVLPTELQSDWVWRLRGSNVWFNVGRTIVFPGDEHATAIRVLSAGCSKTPSAKWPQLESDVFGFCAREKGYDSIQFLPYPGMKPIGSFPGAVGLIEMVMVNLDGQYTCGTQNASATPLRAGWHASRPCECENQPIDPTCGMTPFPAVPIWMQPCSPPICKVQGDNPKTACNPATCTYTTCKSPSPTPARACSAALKSHCGDAQKRGSVECDICVDFHSQQLSKASCTKAQLESFCAESSGI